MVAGPARSHVGARDNSVTRLYLSVADDGACAAFDAGPDGTCCEPTAPVLVRITGVLQCLPVYQSGPRAKNGSADESISNSIGESGGNHGHAAAQRFGQFLFIIADPGLFLAVRPVARPVRPTTGSCAADQGFGIG